MWAGSGQLVSQWDGMMGGFISFVVRVRLFVCDLIDETVEVVCIVRGYLIRVMGS